MIDNQNLVEIDVEYVYLTIPKEYVCIYHKLLAAIADFGKEIVDNCDSICKTSGKDVMSCWNLFQSAIACRSLGRQEEAEFFIKYIEEQLNLIYKGKFHHQYTGTNYYPITPDGQLKALCSCFKDNVTFKVDTETGELYEEYLNGQVSTSSDGTNRVFTMEDEYLEVISNDKV